MKQTVTFSPPSQIRKANKSLTTNANNTTSVNPLFRITGVVRVIKLYGIVTTVLGTNHTAAHWRFNDQTAQPVITLVTGTTLSSAPAGSMITKFGLVGAALTLASAAAGVVSEPTTLETLEWSEFTLTAKAAANSDLEYVYTTSETPTSGVIQFFLEYEPISATGAVTVL